MREILLVRFGEVFLKGQNRPFFMKKLMDHIRQAVRPVNGRVWMSEGRFYVSDFTDMDECIRRVTRVFGVHSVSPAIEMDKDDFGAICEQAAKMMEPLSGTFKVLARRSDKRYPLDSPAIMREAGGYILEHVPHLSVDVNHPDHTMMIEIRDHAYLSVKRIPAVEGMPMGTNGKACLLLSGGIDSPVAGYMIAKRGVEIECIHFFSYPYTSELAKEKVLELAHIMTKFCGRMTVDIVGFTEIQEAIRDHCREEYFTIIMRRFMMRIAEAIGRDHGAKCLVTGENLGQVASQTMDAMAVTGAVVHMPIFHPLIGMDKEEIVAVARRIGTLDTSILPYEDCCTVFTPKHPKTKPVLAQVEAEEQKLDVEGLIARAIANTEKTQIRYYEDEHKG